MSDHWEDEAYDYGNPKSPSYRNQFVTCSLCGMMNRIGSINPVHEPSCPETISTQN